MNFRNRNVLITGGSMGLGKSIAEHFVAEGANVIICGRSEVPLANTCQELQSMASEGQKIRATTCDISSQHDLEALYKLIWDQIGEIDILVNCAAIYGPISEVGREDWELWLQALRINLIGAVMVTRMFLPDMKDHNYGKIVFLAGGGATRPMKNFSAYATSKAGVVRFMETLALELRTYHIDVNAIAPGMLKTRLTEETLLAGPDRTGMEIYHKAMEANKTPVDTLKAPSELCLYLCSHETDGITGKLISAVWDDWRTLHERKDKIHPDAYTLRRITIGEPCSKSA